MRTLEPQENDETKLVAVFDIENFTAPIGRVSECFMKLEVIDDDYKRFLKNPPTWHSNESILPDEITVPDILRDANYKAMLQIHITFDNENVSSLTGKPSEIIYKCPGEVSIKLIQKVFDYTRNNTIWIRRFYAQISGHVVMVLKLLLSNFVMEKITVAMMNHQKFVNLQTKIK